LPKPIYTSSGRIRAQRLSEHAWCAPSNTARIMITWQSVLNTFGSTSRRLQTGGTQLLCGSVVYLAASLLVLRGLPLQADAGIPGYALACVLAAMFVAATTFVPRWIEWRWRSILSWSPLLLSASICALSLFWMGWDSLIARDHPLVAQLALLPGVNPDLVRRLLVGLFSTFLLLLCWQWSLLCPPNGATDCAAITLPRKGSFPDIEAVTSAASAALHPEGSTGGRSGHGNKARPRQQPRVVGDGAAIVQATTTGEAAAERTEQIGHTTDHPPAATLGVGPRRNQRLVAGGTVIIATIVLVAAIGSGLVYHAALTQPPRGAPLCGITNHPDTVPVVTPASGAVGKHRKDGFTTAAPNLFESSEPVEPKQDRRGLKRDRLPRT
jgi:hypothetical protein